MAMTPAGLSAAIVAQLGPATDTASQKAFADAIATAVVSYIQTNAVVSVSVAVPATGIIAPNGPCTGAASGTGTGTIA